MRMPVVVRCLMIVFMSCIVPMMEAIGGELPAPATVVLTDERGEYPLGHQLMILEDPAGTLTLDDVRSATHGSRFVPSTKAVPSYGFTPSAYWVKVDLDRQTRRESQWLLELSYAPLQHIDLYSIHQDGTVRLQKGGSSIPYGQRPYAHHRHVFELDLPDHQTTALYLRVASEGSINIPLTLFRADVFAHTASRELAVLCIYAGIALGLICYNIFIFATLKESAYLLYVCFLGASLLLIMSVNGISQIVLVPDSPAMGARLIPLSVGLIEIFGFTFAQRFLQTRTELPRLHKVLAGFTALSVVACLLPWLTNYRISTVAATFVGLLGAMTLIISGIVATVRGYRPARYFLLAWMMLLFGIVLFVLRAYGILPSNLFTEYTMLWGSAAEAILLSVALAARMRIMKEEKELAQATQLATQQALVTAQAETLTTQQALVSSQAETLSAQQESLKNKQIALDTVQKYSLKLEDEVRARTAELVETQQKLVASEKMAALGVFTAGMAHEINNPANFVSGGAQNAEAQLSTFRHFVGDLLDAEGDPEIKNEFDGHFTRLSTSLGVIRTGIVRIENVVKHLRATHPEGDVGMQAMDIADLLTSAWQVFSPTLTLAIDCISDFQARPLLPCSPADMQQVFIALMSNAAHSIEDAAGVRGPDYHGRIELTTRVDGQTVILTVADNGMGIAADHTGKVFDPFFTTKAVGRGAGLGLSMARDVVKKHHGTIGIDSTGPQGTVFCLRFSMPPLV
jgi:signal transduction histidine kinase